MIWRIRQWRFLFLGLTPSIITIFSEEIKKISMELYNTVEPFLIPISVAFVLWAFISHSNRKTQVMLIGIHVLDNIRFHKIKDGKIKELLYLNKSNNANTMQEERELREELQKSIHGMSKNEINYVCDSLYREVPKFNFRRLFNYD